MQFFASDWLNDPLVSMCEPQTRGILMDWICNMHLLDRSGVITGTREQLARLGRCSAVQVESVLADLETTKAADVMFRSDVVTVTNRRMKREATARKNGAIRVSRHRSNAPCSGVVTPQSQKSESESESEERAKGARAPFPEAESPSWKAFWEYCQSVHCGLAAEFYARDKWEAANADNWQKKSDWRAYARRCKGWWQQDGSPMQPKMKNGKPNPATQPVGGRV
jgi:hypothetical protein